MRGIDMTRNVLALTLIALVIAAGYAVAQQGGGGAACRGGGRAARRGGEGGGGAGGGRRGGAKGGNLGEGRWGLCKVRGARRGAPAVSSSAQDKFASSFGFLVDSVACGSPGRE